MTVARKIAQLTQPSPHPSSNILLVGERFFAATIVIDASDFVTFAAILRHQPVSRVERNF